MRDVQAVAAAIDLALAIAIFALTVDVIRGAGQSQHLRSWIFFAVASVTLVVHSGLAALGDSVARDLGAVFEVITIGFLAIGFALLYGADRERIRTLEHEAERDPLTDLYNFRAFGALATTHLARAGGRAAVVVLDLDGFKAVNDTSGHAAGDRVLQLVAAAIRANLRDTDVAGRYGGDEFVIMIDGDALAAARIVKRIQSSVSALSSVTSGTISFSAGIADHETPCRDLRGLLDAADSALLEVKRSGKRSIAIATAV